MKLLSMFTAASLAFSSFAAMAIPMTAYAAVELDSVTVEPTDGKDIKIVTGYESAKEVTLTVTETFTKEEVDEFSISDWDDVSVISVDGETEGDSYTKFTISAQGTPAVVEDTLKLKSECAVLGIGTGLYPGVYEVKIGKDADNSDTLSVTVIDPFEATITPDKVGLNKTTTSAKVKADYEENTETKASAVTYKWEIVPADSEYADWVDAFTIPDSAKTANKSNAEVEISVSKDADKIFEAAKKKNSKIESISAYLVVEEDIDGESYYADVKVTYTPVEEKKDEPKKEDDKAPAAKGTELKDTTGTFKVTDAGEVEYEAPATTTAKTVTIPDEIKDEKGNVYKVTSVAPNAFKNNKKITKAVIGKNVTTIGANAFSGCKKLKNLELDGNVVKTIGKNAFKGTKKGLKVKIFAKNKKTAQKLFKKVVKTGKAKEATLKFKKRAVKK